MSFFIAEAAAQTGQAAAPENQGFMSLIMIGGLFLFMYFLIIRPQRKRQKEHKQLVDSLEKGNEVVLTSGMLGKITAVDEDYIVIKVTDNVELKFQKIAVHAVIPKGTLNSINK